MTENTSTASSADTEAEEEYDIEVSYDGQEEFTPGDDAPRDTCVYDNRADNPLALMVYADEEGSGIPQRPSIEDIKNPLILNHAHATALIARHTVRQARRMLFRGPLNQLLPLEDPNYPESPPNFRGDAPPGYVCGKASPKYLNTINDSLSKELMTADVEVDEGEERPLLSPFECLLARFYTAGISGCGVCSDFSALTAGLLSMFAISNERKSDKDYHATILRVSHQGDHSFCLFSYGRSPWFVVDPWVMEPYAIPIERNYFGEEHISAFTRIEVFRKLEHPFGIPSMSYWDEAHLEGPPVGFLGLNNAKIAAARAIWENLNDGLEKGHGMLKPRAKSKYANPTNNGIVKKVSGLWGADPLAEWVQTDGIDMALDSKWHNFHVDHVWSHTTNHGISGGADGGKKYAELRQEQRPAAYAHEWGTRVGPHLP